MIKNERYNILIKKLNAKLHQPELLLLDNKNNIFKIETYKVIKSSLLSKYIKSVKAIAFLDMNGFFEDAKIILRTVFEIMIILLYCNINEEENFNRYKKYKSVTINNYIKTLGTEEKKKVNKEALANNEKEFNEFKEEYIKNKKDEKYWNGKTFKETMEIVSKKYDASIKDLYYNVYMLNCEKVHSDFLGIINDYLIVSNDKIEINADIKKDINYTVIIQNLEEISQKLDYINFSW